MVHPNDGLRPQRNLLVLLLHSRKMKGYTLQQNRCTSSSHSHSLSSSTIQCPHLLQLQWSLLKPYKGLITCNTMGYNKPCARPKPPLNQFLVKVNSNNLGQTFKCNYLIIFLTRKLGNLYHFTTIVTALFISKLERLEED